MLNAEGLAKIMNDLFDGVVYAGIVDIHVYIYILIFSQHIVCWDRIETFRMKH